MFLRKDVISTNPGISIETFQIAKDELNQADIKLFFHGDPSSINPSLPLEDQVLYQ